MTALVNCRRPRGSNEDATALQLGSALATAFLLATIVLVQAGPMATAQTELTPREAIDVSGNEELDAIFAGDGTDGLLPRTAHVIEGHSFDVASPRPSIRIADTTRHLVIRGCQVSNSVSGQDSYGIQLINCSNVTVTDCRFPDSEQAISLERCHDVTVTGNRVSGQHLLGIEVDGSRDVLVSDNRMKECPKCVLVVRSDNVTVSGNRASASERGILLSHSRDCLVLDNRVEYCTHEGIHLTASDGNSLHNNTLWWNDNNGINIEDSEGVLVEGNHLVENYRGMILWHSRVTVRDNLFEDGVLGLRLQSCTDCIVIDNELKSQLGEGISVVETYDSRFLSNSVSYCARGISMQASSGNEFSYNFLLANYWEGIHGSTGHNTFRDNDLRANGWARSLLYLIVFLVVVGIAIAVVLWARRRRLERREERDVLVRTRFSSGNKGLWAISKYLWDEDFFQAQLASAGPQREQILERYKSNIRSAKQMQYMATGTMGIMLGLMAALPLGGVLNVVSADVDPGNVNDVLFASSMSIGVFYVMSFLILLVFGLLFMANLMKGEMFRLLATLPLDRSGLQRAVGYVLLRMYGFPFAMVLLAFPVGGLLITRNIAFFATSLFVNAIYLVFIAFILLLLSNAMSRRVFSANATKGATLLRVLVMASYLIGMMFVFITLDFLMGYVSDLFATEALAGTQGEMINSGVSLVAFPFSGAYLTSLSLVSPDHVPLSMYLSTLGGMLLLLGVTYGLRRVGTGILMRVARGAEITTTGTGQVTTVEQLVVRVRGAIPAFVRNSLTVTSRDMGALMYLIMPVVFPLIVVVAQMGEPASTGSLFEPVFPYLMYIGIMPFLINMALSSSDAEMGGVLSTLPFRTRDQYRAKQLTMFGVMLIPLLIIAAAMVPRVPEPRAMLMLLLALVPLNAALVTLYLISFSAAFGVVNGRYTFFMARIRAKLAKYIGIILLQYVLMVLVMAIFGVMLVIGWLSLTGGIFFLVSASTLLFLVLEVVARGMFR